MSNLLNKVNQLPASIQPTVRRIISLATTGTIEEAQRQIRRLIGAVSGDKAAYVNRVSEMTSDERDTELDALLSEGEAMANANAAEVQEQRKLAEEILDNLVAVVLTSAVEAGLTTGA